MDDSSVVGPREENRVRLMEITAAVLDEDSNVKSDDSTDSFRVGENGEVFLRVWSWSF